MIKTLLQIWGSILIFKGVGFYGLELNLLVPSYRCIAWNGCLFLQWRNHTKRNLYYIFQILLLDVDVIIGFYILNYFLCSMGGGNLGSLIFK